MTKITPKQIKEQEAEEASVRDIQEKMRFNESSPRRGSQKKLIKSMGEF